MVALICISHRVRPSLHFSLNPAQSGDRNLCWFKCRSINRHNTLLPSCFFQSANHEAKGPAKGQLWVWTQGKDNYRSVSTKKELYSEHIWAYKAVSSACYPPRTLGIYCSLPIAGPQEMSAGDSVCLWGKKKNNKILFQIVAFHNCIWN